MKNKRVSNWMMQYWNIVLLTAIVLILYSVINWLTPVWCDDLDYGADGHTLSDIFHRETHDYLYANGRIFSHSLVQLFVGIIGKAVFNLLNPIMTLLMIALLPFVAGIDFRNRDGKWGMFFLLSLSFFLVWFVLPDQYITMFMVAGSSNYIWAAVLNFLFVSVFIRFLAKYKELGKWKWMGVCVLAFFAGAWMEMYSLALAPALFCCLLLNRNYRNKKMLLTFALYALGAAVVILAPGNFVRQGQTVESLASVSTWLVNQLELAIKFKLIWVWVGALLLLVYELLKKRIKMKEFLSENLAWLIGISVAYAFLFVSGVSSWRSQWNVFLFSFVILFWLLSKLRMNGYVCAALSAIFLIGVGADFSRECRVCSTKNKAVSEMLFQAKTGTLTDDRCYLWPKTSDSRKSIPVPTGLNGSWPGNSFSTYYHLGKIVIMPEWVYSFCSGQETDYPSYFGLFPMIDEYAVVRCADESRQSVTIEYEFMNPKAFVLSSKVRRLVSAMGFDSFARSAYASKDDLFLGETLLKEMDPLESKVEVGAGPENVYLFDYQNQRYLVAPVKMMKPKYDLAVSSCTLR